MPALLHPSTKKHQEAQEPQYIPVLSVASSQTPPMVVLGVGQGHFIVGMCARLCQGIARYGGFGGWAGSFYSGFLMIFVGTCAKGLLRSLPSASPSTSFYQETSRGPGTPVHPSTLSGFQPNATYGGFGGWAGSFYSSNPPQN